MKLKDKNYLKEYYFFRFAVFLTAFFTAFLGAAFLTAFFTVLTAFFTAFFATFLTAFLTVFFTAFLAFFTAMGKTPPFVNLLLYEYLAGTDLSRTFSFDCESSERVRTKVRNAEYFFRKQILLIFILTLFFFVLFFC